MSNSSYSAWKISFLFWPSIALPVQQEEAHTPAAAAVAAAPSNGGPAPEASPTAEAGVKGESGDASKKSKKKKKKDKKDGEGSKARICVRAYVVFVLFGGAC